MESMAVHMLHVGCDMFCLTLEGLGSTPYEWKLQI